MTYLITVGIVLAVNLVLAAVIGFYLRGVIRKQLAPMLGMVKKPPVKATTIATKKVTDAAL